MRRAFQARYIFTGVGRPLRDASLTIDGGRIVSVGRPDGPLEQLGNVALLPGLINAHTHLEFSELAAPLAQPGVPLVDWIRLLVLWRRQQAASGPAAVRRKTRAVTRGLDESQRCGVRLIGEIATPEFDPGPFLSATVEGVVFVELLGLALDRVEPLLALARQHVITRDGVTKGVSPHAPYTVGPDLLARVARLSREIRFPLAMHLAESTEELELLASHSGPFVELLRELDAWQPQALPRGIRPRDYLELLADAHRALVIHGNYLTPDEICFVGQHRGSLSVVYCPRSHAYFQHTRYPLAEMFAARVNVAVGTDSRASNPDLSVWNELQWVAHQHGDVPPDEILRMGTSNAARALGCADQRGSLEPGKRADFVILQLPEHTADDPYELLFDPSSEIVECGQRC